MEIHSCQQWVGMVSEAPTLRPSSAAFKDPYKFIQGIRHILELYGAVKVVPPHSFALGSLASAAVKSEERDIELTSQLVQPEEQPQPQHSGRFCACSEYESLACQAMREEYGNLPPSQSDVEIKFWEYMSQIDPPSVRVENSMPIKESGFSRVEECACPSEWNFAEIPYHSQSLLRHFDEPLDDMWWSPCLEYRMLYSYVPWKMKGLGTVHYVHAGSGTTWYSVPPAAKAEFEEAKKKMTGPVSPQYLKECGVPIFRLCQHAGEIVIVAPLVYRFILSQGFEIMESVGVGLREWINSTLFNDPCVPIEYAIQKEKELVKKRMIAIEAANCIAQAECRLLHSIRYDLESMKHQIAAQNHPDVLLLLDRFYGFKCGTCGHYCHLAMVRKVNGVPGEFCTRCARTMDAPAGGFLAILPRSLTLDFCKGNGWVKSSKGNWSQDGSLGFHLDAPLQEMSTLWSKSGGQESETEGDMNKVWKSFRKAEEEHRIRVSKEQPRCRGPATQLEPEGSKRFKGSQGRNPPTACALHGEEQQKGTSNGFTSSGFPKGYAIPPSSVWGTGGSQRTNSIPTEFLRLKPPLQDATVPHNEKQPLQRQGDPMASGHYPSAVEGNPFTMGSRGKPGQNFLVGVPNGLHHPAHCVNLPTGNGSGHGMLVFGGQTGHLSPNLAPGGVLPANGPAQGLLRELSGVPIARSKSVTIPSTQSIKPSRVITPLPPSSSVVIARGSGNIAQPHLVSHGVMPNLSRRLTSAPPALFSDTPDQSTPIGVGLGQRASSMPHPIIADRATGVILNHGPVAGEQEFRKLFGHPIIAREGQKWAISTRGSGAHLRQPPLFSGQLPSCKPDKKLDHSPGIHLRVLDSTPIDGLRRSVLAPIGASSPKFLLASEVVAALLKETENPIPSDFVYSTTHGVFRRAAEVAVREGMPAPIPPRCGIINEETHVVLSEEDIRVLHFALDAEKGFSETLDKFVDGVWEGSLLDNSVVLNTWRQGQERSTPCQD